MYTEPPRPRGGGLGVLYLILLVVAGIVFIFRKDLAPLFKERLGSAVAGPPPPPREGAAPSMPPVRGPRPVTEGSSLEMVRPGEVSGLGEREAPPEAAPPTAADARGGRKEVPKKRLRPTGGAWGASEVNSWLRHDFGPEPETKPSVEAEPAP